MLKCLLLLFCLSSFASEVSVLLNNEKNTQSIKINLDKKYIYLTSKTKKVKLMKSDFIEILKHSILIGNHYYDPEPKDEPDQFFTEEFNKELEENNVIEHFLFDLNSLKKNLGSGEYAEIFNLNEIEQYVIKNAKKLISGDGKKLYDYIQEQNKDISNLIETMILKNGTIKNDKNWPSTIINNIFNLKRIDFEWSEIPKGVHYYKSAKSNKIVTKSLQNSFKITKKEITQSDWVKVMGYNRSHFRLPKFCKNEHEIINSYDVCPNLPVETVSYKEIQIFIMLLNKKISTTYDLPTELQWEIATRGKTKTKYFFGDNADKIGEYAWYSHNSKNQSHAVGLKKPNKYGLYDVYGNVWEFVKPLTPFSEVVVRGGYWHAPPWFMSSSYRMISDKTTKADDSGFRIVQSYKFKKN